MTPEQMQQAVNQWAQTAIAGTPFWMKALFLLQVLSLLATVVCLPLITWKLYFGNKRANPTSLLPAEQARLQQIRERRETLQHLSTPSRPVSSGEVRRQTDEDSRYMPKG